MPLPYVVPPQYANPHVRLEIHVELTEKDPIQFARRLKELHSYTIALSYSYEDLNTEPYEGALKVQGDFSAFKQQVIDRWKTTKDIELLYPAVGLE